VATDLADSFTANEKSTKFMFGLANDEILLMIRVILATFGVDESIPWE